MLGKIALKHQQPQAILAWKCLSDSNTCRKKDFAQGISCPERFYIGHGLHKFVVKLDDSVVVFLFVKHWRRSHGCGVDPQKVLDTVISKKSLDSSICSRRELETFTRFIIANCVLTSRRCIDTFDTASKQTSSKSTISKEKDLSLQNTIDSQIRDEHSWNSSAARVKICY